VTDSDTVVRYAEGKDGINNLMNIYSTFTGKTHAEIEQEFDGRGYGDFKLACGEACADALAPVQAEYNRLVADKPYLEAVMKKGADEAYAVARRTLSKVKKKIGFVI
jgi:tryptophanyl-tRNA synthetase